jgi:hypothetical protein
MRQRPVPGYEPGYPANLRDISYRPRSTSRRTSTRRRLGKPSVRHPSAEMKCTIRGFSSPACYRLPRRQKLSSSNLGHETRFRRGRRATRLVAPVGVVCVSIFRVVRVDPSSDAMSAFVAGAFELLEEYSCASSGAGSYPQRGCASGSMPRVILLMISGANSRLPGWKRPIRTSRNSCSMRCRLKAPAPPVRSRARSTIS